MDIVFPLILPWYILKGGVFFVSDRDKSAGEGIAPAIFEL